MHLQVPQLTPELDNVMLNSEIRMESFPIGIPEFGFSHSQPIPVQNLSPEHIPYYRDGSPDLFDLEQDTKEFSFYDNSCSSSHTLKPSPDLVDNGHSCNTFDFENPAYRTDIKEEYQPQMCNNNQTSDYYPQQMCDQFSERLLNACMMDVQNTYDSHGIPFGKCRGEQTRKHISTYLGSTNTPIRLQKTCL